MEISTKFQEFQDNENDDVGYNRHLEIQSISLRMRAILGLESDDLYFIRDTYKYSVTNLPRPQEKKKKRTSRLQWKIHRFKRNPGHQSVIIHYKRKPA